MFINNTEISIRGHNVSETSASYSVEDFIYLDLVLHDKFKNVLSDFNHTASLKIMNLKEKDYEQQYTIKNDQQTGVDYIQIRLLVKKICQLGRMILNIDGQSIDVENINREKMPETIDIVAGKVSHLYKEIYIDRSNSYVGRNQSILIQTKDKYNNTITRKTENLVEVDLKGHNLPIVESDTVPTEVVNNGNGTYSINYVVGWKGSHQLRIKLDNLKYHQEVLVYDFYACPVETPIRCVDGSCKSYPHQCNFDYPVQKESNSSQLKQKCKQDQIYCSVNLVNTCVDNHQKCDCKSDHKRCGNICIQEDEECFIEDYVKEKNKLITSR